MIDQGLIEQLKTVFQKLEGEVTLVISSSDHDQQEELEDFLTQVSTCSDKIKLKFITGGVKSTAPHFHIETNGNPNGVIFTGIPSGHEFSSLILAILNSDLKGKFPDTGIIEQIKRLKGPIKLRTFISLTCENCPDVVQTLNQMAILHPQFEHQMIDGAFTQEEIERLNIQGVPAVFSGDKLISSGKISFMDLLSKLQTEFGTDESTQPISQNLGDFDVVVIGGGPAGASAAIYSARKGLKTAILAETFGGQVKDTKGIENLISTKYTEGPQLVAALKEHVLSYPIQIFEHRRVKSVDNQKLKHLTLESGETLQAKSVIVASGAKWRELGIPGEKEYLGRGVAFCPHCDGPFYKGKKVAVIGGGNSGVEAAIDLAGIVSEVVVFEFNPQLKADQVLIDKLQSLSNVSIVTNAKTESIVGDGQKVKRLEYTNRTNNQRTSLDLDGIFVQIGLVPNSQFLKGQVEMSPFGEIIIDTKGRTSVPGIYAAGDVTIVPYKQIVIAMGEGAKAALTAFEDVMIKGI